MTATPWSRSARSALDHRMPRAPEPSAGSTNSTSWSSLLRDRPAIVDGDPRVGQRQSRQPVAHAGVAAGVHDVRRRQLLAVEAVTQSAAKLSDRIIDPAIAEMARIGAASATGVRTAVRTWSRASRADDVARRTNGRATSEASAREDQPAEAVETEHHDLGHRIAVTRAKTGRAPAATTSAAPAPPRQSVPMTSCPRSVAAVRRRLLERRHRRDPGRPLRGAPAAEQGHPDAARRGDRPGQPRCRTRSRSTETSPRPRAARGRRAPPASRAGSRPRSRGPRPPRLAEHHPADLPRRRADQPQQAELAPPGGDHEAEGAADHEDRHEHRDRRP